MINPLNFLRATYRAARRRVYARRRGSVLILVVALLVLIALVGTAWMVSTRTDRAASGQSVANTKVDLLLEGAVRMAQSVIIDSASGYSPSFEPNTRLHKFVFKSTDAEEQPVLPTPVPRPSVPTLPQLAGSKPYDHVFQNWWMADRVPVLYFPTRPLNNNVFGWRAISWPMTTNPRQPGVENPSPTPRWDAAVFDRPDNTTPSLVLNRPRSWYFYEPVTRNYGGRTDWPFLKVYALTDTVGPTATLPSVVGEIPAADADGDGIPDSGLWRLPVGQVNGLTWYVGMRIIDNGSAFNASVNWKPNSEYINYDSPEPNKGLAGDFFPTNIDLESELYGASAIDRANQMAFLNAYRFNDPNFSITGGTFGPYAQTTPLDESGAARADFTFISPYDQLWHQLGRRLGNPGYYVPPPNSQRFQALQDADGTSLAYGFILQNRNFDPQANIEYMLRNSLSLASTHQQPYGVAVDGTDFIRNWFIQNFDYSQLATPGSDLHSRRALMVTRNPVSNLAAAHEVVGDPDQQWLRFATGGDPLHKMPEFSRGNIMFKAPINTGGFGELWRAFFMVMDYEAPDQTTRLPGFPTDTGTRMFRSPVRDPDGANALPPQAELQVRAALAAVNAIDIRDGDNDVTSRRIQIPTSGQANSPALDVTVYGTEKQPFITEIYVNNDNSAPTFPPEFQANPKGYIAIELYNPYSQRIDLKNWNLVLVDRRSGQPRTMKLLTGFNGFGTTNAPNIPPGGYLILHNYYADSDSDHVTLDDAVADKNRAKHVPFSAAGPVPGAPGVGGSYPFRAYYVRNLHEVIRDEASTADHPGYEITLVRPRRADGILTADVDFDEINGGFRELLAVDSFDFTDPEPNAAGGFRLVNTGTTDFSVYHYNRITGPANANFRCVYPGRYYANAASNPARPAGYQFRHEGVQSDSWNPNSQAVPPDKFDPWDYIVPRMPMVDPVIRPPATPVALGKPDVTASYSNNTFVPIQLNNEDFGGPNKPIEPLGAAKNHYPFGAFGRLGDLLQVPFIGGFRIKAFGAGPTVDYLEASSVTMDCAFADDLDVSNNAIEQVGRFCPLRAVDPTYANPDFYSWARDLFDYFTIFVPADDFTPNANPLEYGFTNAAGQRFSLNSKPTPNAGGRTEATANQLNELYVPVEGRINLNTAPIPVIAGLPFTNDHARNIQIATKIVQYRDGVPESSREPGGPFKSLFDLHKVPDFQTAGGTIDFTADQDDVDGDLTPAGGRKDGIVGDFESRFLALNRISNLVTLQSDSFTCYITLQGWARDGTSTPKMMIERRTAFVGDRSAITPITRDFTPAMIPTK